VASFSADANWSQAINSFSLSDKYAAWRDDAAPLDGSSIYALAGRTNKPLRLTQAELEAHPAWRGFDGAASEHPPMRGWLAAPMTGRGGRNIGLLQLSDKEAGDFTESDEAILVQLAQMAAVAIENARLYQEAQEAILVRDDFLSIASHELKTPLTSLQLQAQSLLRLANKGNLLAMAPERLINKLELIDQQSSRLTRLANDLLDVARIRAGRIDVRLEELDVAALVRDVVERFEEQLALAGCSVDLGAADAVLVWSDRLRIEQVITNLLSNAIKYGAGKPIEISFEVGPDSASFTVRDQGIGIAPEHLERIFIRFERAVSARNYGGLGLGLYIARQIVESLGGAIRVTSEPGVGSAFTVTLPRLTAQR
jgi:signal transduction histidine kinase